MKTIPTQINRKYSVSSTVGCTITDSSGTILCNVSPQLQTDFTAISNSISTDDDNAVVSLLFCTHTSNSISHGDEQTYVTGSICTLRSEMVLDLGELTADTDLSTLDFAESGNVQTAELWFNTGSTVPTITWPAESIWCDSAPILGTDMAYRFALRREPNGKLIINLAYEYPSKSEN